MGQSLLHLRMRTWNGPQILMTKVDPRAIMAKGLSPSHGHLARKSLGFLGNSMITFTTNTKRWINVVLMLGQRRRRWTSIKITLSQCLCLPGGRLSFTRIWNLFHRLWKHCQSLDTNYDQSEKPIRPKQSFSFTVTMVTLCIELMTLSCHTPDCLHLAVCRLDQVGWHQHGGFMSVSAIFAQLSTFTVRGSALNARIWRLQILLTSVDVRFWRLLTTLTPLASSLGILNFGRVIWKH